jgi:hypothetical protein
MAMWMLDKLPKTRRPAVLQEELAVVLQVAFLRFYVD